MSQEKVLKTLESLGLTELEAQVYIFLGRRGPQRALDMSKALKMRRQRLYPVLKNLESKGIVNATLEHPTRFSALPFDRALDLFVKAKTEDAKRIEGAKEALFSDWQSISIAETADKSPKFSVIEGRNHIYPRLRQMIEETKTQLSLVSTVSGLVRADQFGLIEAAINHASKTRIRFRFLTELSDENLKAMKLLLERMPKGSGFEGRTPELGMKLVSRMLLKDNTEAAFFVSQDTDRESERDDVCLWTNSSAIVGSFAAVFEDLWHNSTDVEKRIAEIESGRPTAQTYVISDAEVAKKKYDDAVDSAREEIVMVTSSAGIVDVCKDIARLKRRAEQGVSFRIMAPITGNNLEAALHLSELCSVRHVPANYLATTIIDGKHLYQFKPAPSSAKNLHEPLSFENTFYTNDPEYVNRTVSLLNEVWMHAVAPSAATVEEITKPPMPMTVPVPDGEHTATRKDSPYQKIVFSWEEKPEGITEEYVLNKIINARRIIVENPRKDQARYYGSHAHTIIHPPSGFGLPDMLLSFYHCTKQSSYGAEDWFMISLWLETPKGQAFVPVAVAQDSPKGVERRKLTLEGTPASCNQLVLKSDEFQVQVHGNTVFAAWTAPIPLLPPQYTLPPGAILFEGYGRLKPNSSRHVFPSGATAVCEFIGLEAFVTFFHPASKYSGPGTDGIIARDVIMTVYPPLMKPNT